MSGMISTSANYHWVRRIEAETNTDGVLRLKLWGHEDVMADQFNMAEIIIFLDDQAAVERLVGAINKAMPSPVEVVAA